VKDKALRKSASGRTETVRLAGSNLTWESRVYNIAEVSNLRIAANSLKTDGVLEFTCQGSTFQVFGRVPLQEAETLRQNLEDILAFHCHAVTTIVFGNPKGGPKKSGEVLENPDVAGLTFPFVHLRNLVIQTNTYDFHQVERFLTYAVNVVGADYLKKRVTVHIYGKPAKLQANLHNTINNLFRHVNIHHGRKP
jgi:hypothetical protein